jgi:transglutaminase-like putative cysteine protease
VSRRLTVTAAIATVAASVVLYPLLATTAWLWLGTGAVTVTALSGTLTRLRPLPVAACLAAATAALALYLNLVFSAAYSFGYVLPSRASLAHLWVLAGQGIATVHRYAPPVPAGDGVLLLTAAGIGIIAVVTDLLAVRLRRPALAGLPLLVLFCVPLTTSANPGPVGTAVGFCLAVAGYLALLSADGREKVRLWGRLVSLWPTDRYRISPETRKLAAAGRRIGFAAAAAALFVPLLLPGRPAQRLLGGGSGPGAGGGGGVYLPNPLAQLNQQLHERRPQTVLTYSTGDASPPYLQEYVLGQLGDNAWSMGKDAFTSNSPVGRGALPAPPGMDPATPGPAVTDVISLGRGLRAGSPGLEYLPVPYPAQSITVPGRWRVDRNSLTIFGAGTRLSGLRYTVTAKDVNPSPAQLRRARPLPRPVQPYLMVPEVYVKRLIRLARRITAHRDTAYGRAVALQRWFTQSGHFRYSLDVPAPASAPALIRFLTTARRGYCQHFAFGMAVLARLLGIPSRVVVGYTQGTFVGGTLWRVSTADAHAWPELYFPGVGWLRFEPTPDGSAGPGQATATPPGYSYPVQPQGAASAAPPTIPSQPGNPATGPAGRRLRPQLFPSGAAAAAGAKKKQPGPGVAGWVTAGLVALLLAAPRASRSLNRRRRWRAAPGDAARAEAAWRELSDDLADHRIGCMASESPRMLARRLSGQIRLGEAENAALARVVAAVERARYARAPASGQTLHADVATLRRAIARSAGRAARWRARLFPPSALAPAQAALQQALDVFGWLDRLTARPDGRPRWQPRAPRRRGRAERAWPDMA